MAEDRKAEVCWKAAENALVFSFPSSRGGNYLVGVYEKSGKVCVVHTCPASSRGYDCWHVYKAAEYYGIWKGKEISPERIISANKPVTLNPKWEQIDVPGEKNKEKVDIPEIPDEIFALVFGEEAS
jgi:hypothetical protein